MGVAEEFSVNLNDVDKGIWEKLMLFVQESPDFERIIDTTRLCEQKTNGAKLTFQQNSGIP